MNAAVPGYAYTDHAQHIVDACHPDAGLHLFALVDAAQFHGKTMSPMLRRLQGLQQRHGWADPDVLYTDTFAAGAKALSPLLLQVPMHRDGEAAASEAITALSDLFIDAPVLSFIASPRKPSEVLQHLRDLLLIETEDRQPFLLRWADTHALTSTMSVLTPEQRSCVLQGVSKWWVADQCGRRIDLHAFEQKAPAAKLPLKFDATQLDALMQASAVSLVSAQLRQADAEFARMRWPEQIDHVARHAERAQVAGFDTMEDLLGWCSAAARGGEHFNEHLLVRMALVEARMSSEPKRLSDALAGLNDDDWLAVRATPTPAPGELNGNT